MVPEISKLIRCGDDGSVYHVERRYNDPDK